MEIQGEVEWLLAQTGRGEAAGIRAMGQERVRRKSLAAFNGQEQVTQETEKPGAKSKMQMMGSQQQWACGIKQKCVVNGMGINGRGAGAEKGRAAGAVGKEWQDGWESSGVECS